MVSSGLSMITLLGVEPCTSKTQARKPSKKTRNQKKKKINKAARLARPNMDQPTRTAQHAAQGRHGVRVCGRAAQAHARACTRGLGPTTGGHTQGCFPCISHGSRAVDGF